MRRGAMPEWCRATRSGAWTVLAVAVLWLAGCAVAPHPWAPPPGPSPTVATGQPPVIFIHGAFGSRLAEGRRGREIWPGGFFKLLFGRYAELAVDIDAVSLEPASERLVVSGLFERTGARDYYHAILRSLRRAGYREGRPGSAATDGLPRYYVLLYDWRYDNSRAVRALDELIAQIRRDHGRADLRVDVIGHSNGGLIARQYARFGTAGVDTGAPAVPRAGAGALRRVVLIGTPNLGTLESLVALTRGEEIGLRRGRRRSSRRFRAATRCCRRPAATGSSTRTVAGSRAMRTIRHCGVNCVSASSIRRSHGV